MFIWTIRHGGQRVLVQYLHKFEFFSACVVLKLVISRTGAIWCSFVLTIVLFVCLRGDVVLLFCDIPFLSTLQTLHSYSLTSIWTKRHCRQRTVFVSLFSKRSICIVLIFHQLKFVPYSGFIYLYLKSKKNVENPQDTHPNPWLDLKNRFF